MPIYRFSAVLLKNRPAAHSLRHHFVKSWPRLPGPHYRYPTAVG